jgi:hypothetical protein
LEKSDPEAKPRTRFRVFAADRPHHPIEIKAGWRGTIIAYGEKPMPCVDFAEEPRQALSGRFGRSEPRGRLGIKMNKPIYV